MKIIKVLSAIAFVCSVVWFFYSPDFEPAIAIFSSLSALIAAWLNEIRQRKQASQNQTIGNNGIGIQSGGDVIIGELKAKGNSGSAK